MTTVTSFPTNLLPFDYTAASAGNVVQNEVHSPRYSTSVVIGVPYNFIIPLHGLFFKTVDFAISRIRGGIETPMTVGTDFYFALKAMDLSRLCQRNVYGALQLVNVQSGDYFIIKKYRAVGDYFIGSTDQQTYFFNNVRTNLAGVDNSNPANRYANLIEEVANKVYNPGSLSWEYVADKPNTYPSNLDMTSLNSDGTNLSQAITAIQNLTATYAASFAGDAATHFINFANPHNTNKTQVQLGLVQNLDLAASLVDLNAVTPSTPDKYVSAKLLQTVNVNLQSSINSAVNAMNVALANHTHDKSTVGLGNLVNLNLAYNKAAIYATTSGNNTYATSLAVKEVSDDLNTAITKSTQITGWFSGDNTNGAYRDPDTIITAGTYEIRTPKVSGKYPEDATIAFLKVDDNSPNFPLPASTTILQTLVVIPPAGISTNRCVYTRCKVGNVFSSWNKDSFTKADVGLNNLINLAVSETDVDDINKADVRSNKFVTTKPLQQVLNTLTSTQLTALTNAIADHTAAYNPHPAYTPVWKYGNYYAVNDVVLSPTDYVAYRFKGMDWGDPHYNQVAFFFKAPCVFTAVNITNGGTGGCYVYDYGPLDVSFSAATISNLNSFSGENITQYDGYGYGQDYLNMPATYCEVIAIHATDNGKVNIASREFCFETKIKINNYDVHNQQYGWIFGRAYYAPLENEYVTTNVRFAFLVNNEGWLCLMIGSSVFGIGSSMKLKLGQRYNIALTREITGSGPVIRIFVDGVVVYTIATTAPLDTSDLSEIAGGYYSLLRAWERDAVNYQIDAELHETRLTLDTPRYTENYAVSSKLLPDRYGNNSTINGGGYVDPRNDPEKWEVASQNHVLVGSIHSFLCITPPSGYVAMNSPYIKVSDYPRLASEIYCGDKANSRAVHFYKFYNTADPEGSRSTGGAYLKLLGDFVESGFVLRNRNNKSTGRDAMRNPVSIESDEIKNHTHDVNDPGHTHSSLYDNETPGSIDYDMGNGREIGAWASNPQFPERTYPTSESITGISVGNSGGTETKMYNLAVLMCFKA